MKVSVSIGRQLNIKGRKHSSVLIFSSGGEKQFPLTPCHLPSVKWFSLTRKVVHSSVSICVYDFPLLHGITITLDPFSCLG